MQGKGIHLKFDNGWTLSIQQSEEHQCTVGRSVEIAAWDADGKWHPFTNSQSLQKTDVLGYVQPDELAAWIRYFSDLDLDKKIAKNAAISEVKAAVGRRYASRRKAN